VFLNFGLPIRADDLGISAFGIGASLMWVSARTIVADMNEPSLRGVAMGRLTTTSVRGSMLGAAYGCTLLGMLPMQEAWRWAFGGYAVLALVGWC
jgi:hypothetical protein